MPNEERLTDDIVVLTKEFGGYGYRMTTGMLNNIGWHVNHKRPSRGLRASQCWAMVERIWRREGLKVSQKQPKKGRLWLKNGSCVRLRAERPNHVWSYDFVQHRPHGRPLFRTEYHRRVHEGGAGDQG